MDKLEAAGFWVSDLIDHGFIQSICSYDPDNISVEFSHNVSGIDTKKNPRMGDAQPANLALEGSEPHKNKWPKVKRATPRGVETRKIHAGKSIGI
jgi:hypothetical protein